MISSGQCHHGNTQSETLSKKEGLYSCQNIQKKKRKPERAYMKLLGLQKTVRNFAGWCQLANAPCQLFCLLELLVYFWVHILHPFGKSTICHAFWKDNCIWFTTFVIFLKRLLKITFWVLLPSYVFYNIVAAVKEKSNLGERGSCIVFHPFSINNVLKYCSDFYIFLHRVSRVTLK